MARPQSVADLGYVPTPDEVVERIRSHLAIPKGATCLDPCCGTGSALKLLAPESTLYGIEVHQQRAVEARGVLDRVLAQSVEDVRVSGGAFELMFLNPPYGDSVHGRWEVMFLERATRWIRDGGILVFIIKDDGYETKIVNQLRRYYKILGHWKFHGEYHAAFHQSVLIAQRTASDPMTHEEVREALRLDNLEELPMLEKPTINVLRGRPPRLFISTELRPEEVEQVLATSPLSRDPENPKSLMTGRPPLPLKQGHVATTLASGAINGVIGRGLLRHVAKGTVVRTTANKHEIESGGVDDKLVVRDITTEAFTVQVRALTLEGKIKDLVGGTPVEEEADAT